MAGYGSYKLIVDDFLLIFTFISIDYRNRINLNNAVQKEWCEEQKTEHNVQANKDAFEESEYAQQTENITRMRGLLEDEMTMKKKQQLKEL